MIGCRLGKLVAGSLCALTVLALTAGADPVEAAEAVAMVRDINTGGHSQPRFLANVRGTVYFAANDGTNGEELWRSDGTAAGTAMVKDINPGGSASPRYLTNVGGTLFLQADDGSNGAELWRSDGTAAGTAMVKDINPGGSAFPSNLTNVGGILYFTAYDGANGNTLWRSDGTAAGTAMVKDINPEGSASPSYLTNVGGTLYFTADDGTNGNALWRSDGTAAGTVMVKDIDSYPYHLTNVGGILYFAAEAGLQGQELWRSDGTAAGTVMVKNINPGGNSFPVHLTNVGGTLFLQADDGINGRELWRSDGTAAGTVMVKDINTGSGSSDPNYLTNVGGALYFGANDGTNGAELWRSDGTAAGTVMVKDIRPGISSFPSYLTNVGGTVYFAATDGTNGTELWRSDGTAAGTVMVKDIHPTSSSYPEDLTNAGDGVYLTADDGTSGRELWRLTPGITLPGEATPLSPGGKFVANHVRFRWESAPKATYYYLWVDGPAGNVVKRWYTETQAGCRGGGLCEVDPGLTFPGGTYKWWIQTWSPAGYGPWSDTVSFTVPFPGKAAPTGPAGSVHNPVTYTWDTGVGATWYYLWVDGPAGTVLKRWYTAAQAGCNLDATCAVVGDPNLSAGPYTFWVQTWSEAGYGPWSAAKSFSVSLPGVGTLISPSGRSDNPVTYTWTHVEGATYYYLWVDGPRGNVIKRWYTARDAECDGECFVTPDLKLEPGSYTWWIRAWSPAGYGQWSPGTGFTVP